MTARPCPVQLALFAEELAPVRTGLFRYVPIARLPEFLARGWMPVAELGRVHGTWSVLGWGCSCPYFLTLNPDDEEEQMLGQKGDNHAQGSQATWRP